MAAVLVEYEPRLVEAAVLAAIRGRPEERAFLRERGHVWETGDIEGREDAFTALHARWFERLTLDAPFRVTLAERPEIAAGCGRCLVVRAIAGSEEVADLRVMPEVLPILLICVRAETVSRSERLLDFLRHELLHVTDMLDPGFGYAPSALGDDGSARVRLARDRYRVLWDAYVDGRLARLGRARSGIREERLRDFARAFSMLGDATEAAFERLFGAPRCTHAELAAFALGARGGRACRPCPLCGLPTGSFEPAPERLLPAVLAAIRGDFPSWTPDDGLCARCAELYSSRAPTPS